jgi:DNA-binding response OmpR family regulator
VKRVLVVEDNETLARGISRSLESAGFAAEVAGGREQAGRALAVQEPDVLVLDLMLPDGDGFEVLQDLRAGGSAIPVLILSARGEEIDKLRGFRLGADDYVVKPVGVLELIARVEALLRRSASGRDTPVSASAGPVRFGVVEVDPARRTVDRDGQPIELSPKEFELLLCLLRHQGHVVTRETLLHDAWGYRASVASRTVDTHVATLRAKLEIDPARPNHILTVRKLGYRLRL